MPLASVHQKTTIAVARKIDPAPIKDDAAQGVRRQPFPIEFYAPPFVITGNIQLMSAAQMYEVMDAARQDYIALSEGTITMDGMSLLPLPSETVLVNRNWITAFHAPSA